MPFGHCMTVFAHQVPVPPPHCWSFVQPPPVVTFAVVVAPVTVADVTFVPLVAVFVVLEDAPPDPMTTSCPHPNASDTNGRRHQDDLIVPPPNCVKKAM